MARKYEIGIAADTGGFEKSIKNGLVEPLEDAADAFDDLEDAAKGADLDRELDKAQKATDKLDDELDDARDSLKKLGYAARDAGDDAKKGMKRAEDGVEEFRDEANSTAREAAASFDGSAESIGDAFQEIAANAFAGFGPAGAVAGLAAAAGIGLAVAAFEGVNEASEESRARAAEWADAFIENGSRVLTFEQEAAKVRDILTDEERYKVATDNAKLWGVAVETAVAAMAGSESAIESVTGALDEKRIASEKEAQAAQQSAEANGSALLALTPAEQEYLKARDALNLLTGELDRGAQGLDIMSRYLIDAARNTEGATETVDEFGDTVISLPDGKQVYVDAETGQATQNVDAIEKKIYGIPDGNAKVVVTADTSNVDREVRRLSGTTIRIGTKIVTSGAGWDR